MSSDGPTFDINRPFHTLSQLSNPAGTNPIGGGLHDWVASWADPNRDPNNSFANQLGDSRVHLENEPGKVPTLEGAALGATSDQYDRENRIRSASTILSGGAGLLDDPDTQSASRSLLGN